LTLYGCVAGGDPGWAAAEGRERFDAAYAEALGQARDNLDLTELFKTLEQWVAAAPFWIPAVRSPTFLERKGGKSAAAESLARRWCYHQHQKEMRR
jgi:hypothetical protein